MSSPSQLVFSDITLVGCGWPCWEGLHHGNWQAPQIRASFLESEWLNVGQHSADLGDRDSLLEMMMSEPNLAGWVGAGQGSSVCHPEYSTCLPKSHTGVSKNYSLF